MPEDDSHVSRAEFERFVRDHENDRYAHAPILLDLHGQIVDLQKLGWMIRGGLVTLATVVTGSILAVSLHLLKVI
jgi:hypothetical protein